MRESASPVRPPVPLGVVAALALLALGAQARAVPQAGEGVARRAAEAARAASLREDDLDALERTTLDAINEERRASGLPPLALSPELSRLARSYSRDMVERRFFDHVDPDGRLVQHRTDLAGIRRWMSVGENIARNRGFKDPVGVAVREWMRSDGHRDNILDTRYTETGIGVWVAPDRTVYFTQIFVEKR